MSSPNGLHKMGLHDPYPLLKLINMTLCKLKRTPQGLKTYQKKPFRKKWSSPMLVLWTAEFGLFLNLERVNDTSHWFTTTLSLEKKAIVLSVPTAPSKFFCVWEATYSLFSNYIWAHLCFYLQSAPPRAGALTIEGSRLKLPYDRHTW